MKNKLIYTLLFLASLNFSAQKLKLTNILEDKISIRALQIWDGKVWYSGTDSKFGFIDLVNQKNKKQIKLSDKNLQFRTLSQNRKYFYAINIESPAHFFEIDKKTLTSKIVHTDTLKTAFYDALHFNGGFFYTFSDPAENLDLQFSKFYHYNQKFNTENFKNFKLNKGEAAFAASNTNIASFQKWVWLATGGITSRILKFNLKTEEIKAIETPFIQGSSSQGMYSIDFHKNKFGIAVGGDYTKQAENINNIATTFDGGETWQIQASGKNAGYSTCVKIRPGSKGKEIVAIGDQHISYSHDFGKTWQIISNEKGFYVCEWIDKNRIAFAGKDKISVGNIFSIFGK
ncbi:beta propeller repeat protein [Frigoriflavimonas asaccharolytica]|uniref:Glycosyl hydrolase n=1 Tax=Frigoriflavimonas asaccharolytica TaxID=2735899 RepID=A0A8J8G817_9FLAO|nr:glycosyl hydrolase [Frigoriflavimonas asaccharolytica]NRS91647.1 hypothetical protein [Frigoriflavimonas asaccharolytica]